MDDREAREGAARVEALLAGLDEVADEAARDQAMAAVQALVELYGEGLTRIVEHAGPELHDRLASDELVGHLLLVHDLHPAPLEERVRRALEEVRPYLGSHGGDVELLGVEGDVARLRLNGSCDGCPSSAMTLKLAVEEAVQRAAPEIRRVQAEGAAAAPARPELLQIEVSEALTGQAGWSAVDGLPPLTPGARLVTEVAGQPLLFLNVERDLYAYRPRCPGCGQSLEEASLRGAELCCASCGKTYDVRRAGRCLDAPALHLNPVPLLADEAGGARVALA